MKNIFCLSLLMLFVVLPGCVSATPMVLPSEDISLLSSTKLVATDTLTPTFKPSWVVTKTRTFISTKTPYATLDIESIKQTIQPFSQDPMNCLVPCFLGVVPGKTGMDQARAFFTTLEYQHREGSDFYSFGYETGDDLIADVILHSSGNLVKSITIDPKIAKSKENSLQQGFFYSPDTLIRKYGKPSRVEIDLGLGQVNSTLNIIMYFDSIDLIVLYRGFDSNLHFCPFTFPLNDGVRLWIGKNPPRPPQFPTVSLEKSTSLTIDEFTQMMLGDPQNICLPIDIDLFQ